MSADGRHGVKVLEEIGSGSYGKVFKCIFRERVCVIKKIPFSEDENAFKSVASEYTVLSKIRHPRVVQMITFYQTIKYWNFVLEYMKNGSLRHILLNYQENCWKFSKPDIILMFLDILDGIKFLHSKGIIHRDLKPENVLVDENHRLKIADFGVAKIMASSDAARHTAIGTFSYMAPEVYLHKPYNKSVDVWALGIIFYEMAMTAYPFSQTDKARILNPKLSFIPPKIDCTRRKYPQEFQILLVMMLQRDPNLRYDLDRIERDPSIKNMLTKARTDMY